MPKNWMEKNLNEKQIWMEKKLKQKKYLNENKINEKIDWQKIGW